MTKQILALILISIIYFSCQENSASIQSLQHTNPMEFSLTFSSKERSRDSRSSQIRYQLKDGILSRTANYQGARAKPASSIERVLTAEQVSKLEQVIKKLQLDKNYKKSLKSKSQARSGVKRHYEAIFEYENIRIEISGDQSQKEDAKAKQLKEFEYILKYLLEEELELFEKRYQKIID
jgi:hypothetical protein